MIRFISLLALLSFWGGQLFAQDPHFSQFYNAPTYLNPGFTGITKQQRLIFNHRTQWPNLPQAFATYAAQYDIWVNELKSGFGILFTNDKMGTAGWKSTTVGLLYSYKIKVSDKVVLSPGLYFGYGINGLDRSKVVLGDGLEFGGATLDPTVQSIGSRQYFDFSAGLLAYTSRIWLGVSVNHINAPNISVLSFTSRLPMRINIHAGTKIPLSGSNRSGGVRGGRNSYLTPSAIFMIQAPITQLALGVNYHIDPISIGIWYRGKPYEALSKGIINQDAIIFQLGGSFKNFTLGYSYDFSVSKLATASGGAHEVSLSYEFAVKGFLRTERRSDLIPCPTFNGNSFWAK